MKKLFLLIALLVSISRVYATTETEEKIMALKVLKKYTETVACPTNFDLENKKPLASLLDNVFTIKRDTKYGEATYYVLWSGDFGCMGGSGTESFYVSEIYRDDSSKPFLVMNDEAFGKAFSEINTRFIESIKQYGISHFEVIALKYGKDDANCCPSLKYQYTVRKNSGEWVISSKKRLK